MNALSNNDALTSWGANQLFAFSGIDGETDFRGGLVAQTLSDGFLFRQPGVAKLYTSPVKQAEFGVDWANLQTEDGLVRLCFLDAHTILITGKVSLRSLSEQYDDFRLEQKQDCAVFSAIGHDVVEPLPRMDDAQQARREWVRSHIDLVEGPYAALGRKALQQMKGMVYAPEGQIKFRSSTPDRYPHREIWLWDSVFHVIGYRHLDPVLAREMLSAVLATQLESGQIGISFGPYATRTHRSQPPILAWGVAQLHAHAPDQDWLASTLGPLRAYLRWFEGHRKLDDLFGWVEDNGHLGSVCDESGMDNSPRFEGGSVLQAVDLSCYMAQEYQAMAMLDPDGGWDKKAAALTEAIHTRLWDETCKLYCDRDVATGKSTGVQAVTGFLPLILGDMETDRVQALADALADPSRFGTKLPLPSIAKCQSGYAKDMWQGPVWVNMNWMIGEGLIALGEEALGSRLREQTLSAMQSDYELTGSIFEYYDDDFAVTPPQLLRKGKNDAVIDPKNPCIHLVIHDYGWSATLALDWIARNKV